MKKNNKAILSSKKENKSHKKRLSPKDLILFIGMLVFVILTTAGLSAILFRLNDTSSYAISQTVKYCTSIAGAYCIPTNQCVSKARYDDGSCKVGTVYTCNSGQRCWVPKPTPTPIQIINCPKQPTDVDNIAFTVVNNSSKHPQIALSIKSKLSQYPLLQGYVKYTFNIVPVYEVESKHSNPNGGVEANDKKFSFSVSMPSNSNQKFIINHNVDLYNAYYGGTDYLSSFDVNLGYENQPLCPSIDPVNTKKVRYLVGNVLHGTGF